MIKIIDNIKLRKKVNTLENKIEELENIIKNELFNNLIDNTNVIAEKDKYKKENKMLREKVRTLKSLLKEKD